MNIELIRKAQEYIKNNHHRFDMGWWIETNNECQTTFCLAGIGWLLSQSEGHQKMVLQLKPHQDLEKVVDDILNSNENCDELFDLEVGKRGKALYAFDSENPFYISSWPDEIYNIYYEYHEDKCDEKDARKAVAAIAVAYLDLIIEAGTANSKVISEKFFSENDKYFQEKFAQHLNSITALEPA